MRQVVGRKVVFPVVEAPYTPEEAFSSSLLPLLVSMVTLFQGFFWAASESESHWGVEGLDVAEERERTGIAGWDEEEVSPSVGEAIPMVTGELTW